MAAPTAPASSAQPAIYVSSAASEPCEKTWAQACRQAGSRAGMTSTDKSDDFIRAHGRESREGVINRKRGVMEMLWALLIGMNSQSQVTGAKTWLPYFDGHFAECNFIFNSKSPSFSFYTSERLHLQSVTSGVTALGITMELNHGNCHHPFIKH